MLLTKSSTMILCSRSAFPLNPPWTELQLPWVQSWPGASHCAWDHMLQEFVWEIIFFLHRDGSNRSRLFRPRRHREVQEPREAPSLLSLWSVRSVFRTVREDKELTRITDINPVRATEAPPGYLRALSSAVQTLSCTDLGLRTSSNNALQSYFYVLMMQECCLTQVSRHLHIYPETGEYFKNAYYYEFCLLL